MLLSKELLMKKLMLAVILLALAAPAWAADVLVKVKTHTDAMAVMGQTVEATDVVSEVWIGGTKMATVSKDNAFIIDLDKNVAYLVNHANKTYVETALPIDFAKLLPPEAAPMAAMMQMAATVTPTTETKKIGQWDCTAYDAALSMMGMTLKLRIWASTQVPFDLATFQAKMMPAVIQGQMRLNAASVAEFAKIKGYQIATETTGDVMGGKLHSTTEVTEMVTKPAPAGTYAPPADYTKNATLSMEDMRRR
jgi:hypothetical protein